MIGNARVLAVVPARSGSKGLPGKNIRPLCGKPLLAWPIAAAKASRYVDRVVVSTDSLEYAEIARSYGADVPVLRPVEYAIDTAPSCSAVIHMLDVMESQGEQYDYILLLEPTSPLTEAADIDAGLERLCANRDIADSLVTVAELVSCHPAFVVRQSASGQLAPYADTDFSRLPRRQDIESLYSLDGSFYISEVSRYRETLSFCHDRTISCVMPHYKSFEVDSLVDFICIEAVLNHLSKSDLV